MAALEAIRQIATAKEKMIWGEVGKVVKVGPKDVEEMIWLYGLGGQPVLLVVVQSVRKCSN